MAGQMWDGVQCCHGRGLQSNLLVTACRQQQNRAQTQLLLADLQRRCQRQDTIVTDFAGRQVKRRELAAAAPQATVLDRLYGGTGRRRRAGFETEVEGAETTSAVDKT